MRLIGGRRGTADAARGADPAVADASAATCAASSSAERARVPLSATRQDAIVLLLRAHI